jgi:hypothetical protein
LRVERICRDECSRLRGVDERGLVGQEVG